MPLDPEVIPLLEQLNSVVFGQETSIEAVRSGGAAFGQFSGDAPPDVGAKDIWIDGPDRPLRIRTYHPDRSSRLPTLAWFHGGGWVRGNVDSPATDASCQALAEKANVVLASVDYRLAPEHPFPAGLNDCIAATNWLGQNAHVIGGDACRMAVAGESSGANFAAAVAIAMRDTRGPRLDLQLLIYPITDVTFSAASHTDFAVGYGLTAQRMRWYRKNYLGDDDETRFTLPLLSPLHVEDASGLPAAHIVTAEFDPLRDEGEAYGERLRAAGVPVTVRRYDGQIHGFMSLTGALSAARRATDEVAVAVAAALRSPR